MGPTGEFPPDHRRSQRPLGSVVGRLDPFHLHERSEPLTVLVDLLAHADQPRISREDSAQQQGFHPLADRCDLLFEDTVGDGSVPPPRSLPKKLARRLHQIMAQVFDLMIRIIDQGLKVPLQMGPAPLQAAQLPVHLDPIAVHHPVVGLPEA